MDMFLVVFFGVLAVVAVVVVLVGTKGWLGHERVGLVRRGWCSLFRGLVYRTVWNVE